jgi:hypothetical protein
MLRNFQGRKHRSFRSWKFEEKRMWIVAEKEALERKHIEMVVKQNGKFHAISVAMKHQQPDKFEKLAKTVEENMNNSSFDSVTTIFKGCINESSELLKNDDSISKWRILKIKLTPYWGTRS